MEFEDDHPPIANKRPVPKVTDIISQLRKTTGNFPRQEQRVADYVLANLDQIAYQRQNEIAVSAGVSVATVNRFCQTLGCQGFNDFRIGLAQGVAASLQYLGNATHEDSLPDQLVQQVFGALVDMLNEARSQLDPEAMQQAIDTLAAARRISFAGVGGGSANVAREGANRFFRLGIPSDAHADGYLQRMLASTMEVGDVIFAISSSGKPAELLDSVAIARQYGAKTICLTKTGSDLARVADISIEIDIPEDRDIFKPSAARLVFLAIIDALAAGAARKNPERVKERLRRIRTSLAPLAKVYQPGPIGD